VSNLLIGVVGALLATNQPAALSNLVTQTTGITMTAIDTNNPVELELEKIEDEDDTAQAEIDGWIRENQEFAAKGAAIPNAELNRRIRERFDSIRNGYDDFIKRHPDYAPARVAYASFLDDLGQENAGYEQLLKAKDIDPKLPSVWNQLGNYYGENGPTTNAFVCYEKAIQLDPTESVYYENFGTTVYLYRKDVREFYHLTEQQVFDKAMALYAKAMATDPTNFNLATRVAQSYYGIKPLRTNDALVSWSNTLKLAHDEIEREGVYIHLARIKMLAGQYAQAQQQLDAVTNEMYAELKRRVARAINDREHPDTNAPVADPPTELPKPETQNLNPGTKP
jgi:tetratricopeptide (TPR) repeat protein